MRTNLLIFGASFLLCMFLLTIAISNNQKNLQDSGVERRSGIKVQVIKSEKLRDSKNLRKLFPEDMILKE